MQLTHENLLTAVKGYHGIIDFPEEGSVVSWLPMAHIAERACSHYIPILLGFTTTCCPDPRQVVAYLPEVRPTWFFAVPRIWEKLKAAIEAGIEAEQDEQKKQVTKQALEVGYKRVDLIQSGQEVPEELEQQWQKFDELVYSKIRAGLGLDRVESLNVGAAPTPPEVIRFYHAIGLPLAELWGMSETTGYGTCNRPDNIKIGTVGPASPGAEIKLAEDGEILIKGPFIMPGYRNNEEKTRETIDEDGWLHTGDVGEFDDDGFLKIVDRKKELIINAAGKNMSPANIESKLKSAGPLIGQAIAIGDSKPYNVALLTLDPDSAPAVRAGERHRRQLDRVARREREGARGRPEGGRRRQRADGARRADQEVEAAAGRVGAGRRGADADDEAEAQADRAEVRGRDRGALREVTASAALRPLTGSGCGQSASPRRQSVAAALPGFDRRDRPRVRRAGRPRFRSTRLVRGVSSEHLAGRGHAVRMIDRYELTAGGAEAVQDSVSPSSGTEGGPRHRGVRVPRRRSA